MDNTRYNQLYITLYEFYSLFTRVNFSNTGSFSINGICFLVDQIINTYDDPKNSSYFRIIDELNNMKSSIDNYPDNKKMIQTYNRVKKRLEDTIPTFVFSKEYKDYLENEINQLNKISSLKKDNIFYITFSKEQQSKSFKINNELFCNILFPKNSKYHNYNILVKLNKIQKSKFDNNYFIIVNQFHKTTISKYNNQSKTWQRIKISNKELKTEMKKLNQLIK